MISPPFLWICEEKDEKDVFDKEQDGCQRKRKVFFLGSDH